MREEKRKDLKMILLFGKQASLENHHGIVHGAKVDQAGILSVPLWPGKADHQCYHIK